jgi:Protein of unknown function (DUF3105)
MKKLAIHKRCVLTVCLITLTACASSRVAGSATATSAANQTLAAASAAPAQSAPPFAGRYYPSQGHTHLNPGEPDDFVYNSNPPTSGPHRELFTDTFISPAPLPKYIQVHLLEHGNVLVQYNCSCPDLAAALAGIAMSYDARLLPANELQPSVADVQNGEEQGLAVIVAPYPNMRSRIALTAWTRLATLQSVNKPKIVSFIDSYLHNEANASQ